MLGVDRLTGAAGGRGDVPSLPCELSVVWRQPGCGSAAGAVGALVPTLFTLSLPGHWASSCHSLQGNQASLSWQRDAVSPVRVDALHAATGPRPRASAGGSS